MLHYPGSERKAIRNGKKAGNAMQFLKSETEAFESSVSIA